MFGMLNIVSHGNDTGIGTEEGTQAEAYDIEAQAFFDVPTGDCTTFNDNGQGEYESEDNDDDANPDDNILEEVTATSTGADLAAKKKMISKRITGYAPKEDVCLCRSWHAISQDVISNAEQKGQGLLEEGGSRLPCLL
jgi:hypothetical protein